MRVRGLLQLVCQVWRGKEPYAPWRELIHSCSLMECMLWSCLPVQQNCRHSNNFGSNTNGRSRHMRPAFPSGRICLNLPFTPAIPLQLCWFGRWCSCYCCATAGSHMLAQRARLEFLLLHNVNLQICFLSLPAPLTVRGHRRGGARQFAEMHTCAHLDAQRICASSVKSHRTRQHPDDCPAQLPSYLAGCASCRWSWESKPVSAGACQASASCSSPKPTRATLTMLPR